MSDKLKMAHADKISDARRDAVIAAAIDFAKQPSRIAHGVKLFKAVDAYQAIAASLCSGCPSPDVCKRHAHCFFTDNDHRAD
ncbi:hypothetical protein [Bradyrhizobium sp. 153]|uniref:hypothetical protein n=1 Tax=Bradyrhizobium sp. 153 TaxID=2782627 RepID=UPI001FFB3693|nr:hypothetical protein [Bradyrhizobium sp. 153]MCK1668636.1 hypothetical protein [Bradyrhizobium sp. 153]